MMRLLLVRHGHVEGIAPERFRGRADIDLTSQGRQAVAQTAERLAGAQIDAIYCSPLKRCRDTANAIAATTHTPMSVLDDFNDLDYGAWQWKTHEEARAEDAELYARWRSAPQEVRFPGGESLSQLSERALRTIKILKARHAGRTVVTVAHDSVNRVILLDALGLGLERYWRLEQSPCGINEIVYEGEATRLVRINDTGHLVAFAHRE
jgi:probable phosphoglycerate mutase